MGSRRWPFERESMSRRRDWRPVHGAASAARGYILLHAPVSTFVGLGLSLHARGLADQSLGAGLALYGVGALLRTPFLGIWITPTHLVARSWLRTLFIPLDSVRHVSTAPYAGGFFLGTRSRSFAMIVISADDKKIELPFTMAKVQRARVKAREISERVRL